MLIAWFFGFVLRDYTGLNNVGSLYSIDDFGDEPFSSVEMQPGDAVLYRGMDLRHGRIKPNPNTWSAHLFLFWVERDGNFKQHAFDAQRLRSELERVGNVPSP